MRRVVFNADDLGLAPGVNSGIVASVRAGTVREVSVLVAGASAESGLAALRDVSPDVGLGLHFSLTCGRALSGPMRGLTDGEGTFLPLPRVLGSCLLRAPDPAEIERELRAQLARLHDLGVEPTHLNGHHHVHVFPVVRDAVFAVLAEGRIGHIRVPLEGLATSRTVSARRALLAALALRFRARLGPGARTLPLVGLDLPRAADSRQVFSALARRLRVRAAEWIVHPHERDAELERVDRDLRWGRRGAADELAALTDPELPDRLRAIDIVPSCYADLRQP